ncbi:hypothetical protein CDAR_515781 [Caerostris darwini]|uniref:Uncharacterized protein n=1 Tax=Caerostris darwini TaxID=1538125 RepID=A0AAV4S3T9_9ARAC|nr:hypothetical protein CDAR_515781 [Caerostris darwini]
MFKIENASLQVIFLHLVSLPRTHGGISGKKPKSSTKLAPPSIHYKKHLQKRSHDNFYYDYPENPVSYDYQAYSNNPLQVGNPLKVAGIAGTAGVALKAFKAKSVLKLLKIPAGLALLGGIAALAAGLAPPAVIGSINLPFNGKRKKRSITSTKLDRHFIHMSKRW